MYILGGETVSGEQLKTLLLIGAMLMICGVFCLWRYWGRAEQVFTVYLLCVYYVFTMYLLCIFYVFTTGAGPSRW